MEFNDYKSTIIELFESNDYGDLLDDIKIERLHRLSNLLVETNKVTNLTAITDEKAIMLKHFLDSATVCKHSPLNSKVIDVGCGAGFPSLPLAILRSDVNVTSLDSTGKKIDFVNKVAHELELNNVEGVCGRAESFIVNRRESYDVCTGRAVSRLNVLSEICIPFVKTGGIFVAMKSSKGEEEYSEAKSGIGRLGSEFSLKENITLASPEESLSREIYIFIKNRKTPLEFPRNYSQITKKPL